MEINWNKYFNHIFVISGCSNFERRNWIDQEFKRVGIEHFNYWYNFSDNKRLILNKIRLNHNYIAYGHYSLIKTCYELGYDNVLIFEDDVCFLNDLKTIYNTLEEFDKIKPEINACLFDYLPWDEHIILFADCYYLDRKGMEYLINCLETYPLNVDCYWYKELLYPNNFDRLDLLYNTATDYGDINISIDKPIQLYLSPTVLCIQKWGNDLNYVSTLDETPYNK